MRHALLSRRGLLGLVAALVAAVAVTFASAEPAGGQVPLECDGGLYLTTGSPDDMQLMRVDQITGSLTPVGPGGLVANGLGHNPRNDHLYGIDRNDPHHIVRVSADGTEDDLGAATGAPASWTTTFVGTFLEDGTYLVLGNNAPEGTPRGTVPSTWAEIDVTEAPPEVTRTFSHPSIGNNDLQDVALNPVDGELYAHSIVRQRIVRIDRSTGAATPVGPTFASPANAGSSFFDSWGRMWLYGSGDSVGDQDTLYRIDDLTTDTPEVVAEGPTVTNSDGASCPFTVGLEKTVAPAQACAGTSVTYRYDLTNESVGSTDRSAPTEGGTTVVADFSDELPDDGRRFVAGSLVNPLGGDVTPYGGTRRLAIEDLRIPHEQDASIRVQVALPADMAPGTVLNQARLWPDGNLGTEILSEYPGTPQLPDATPLVVTSCADLGVQKSTAVDMAGPGDEVAYTVRVTNHGPSDAADVDSVADLLPDGLTFVSASHGGSLHTDGTVRWPAFDLAVGEHLDLTVTATADPDVRSAAGDDGDLDNTASVRHPGDPNDDNDTDTVEVPVDHPDLVVVKDDGRTVVDPGEQVTYTITVRNQGPGDADEVSLVDQLPDELAYLDGTETPRYRDDGHTVVWAPFDLAAGEERSMTVNVRVGDDVPAGTEVLNVAVADHPDDPNPEDNRDDDLDGVERPTPRDEDPVPDDDPPVTWLPRTGLAVASWVAIGLGLVALGLAARWWSRLRPS